MAADMRTQKPTPGVPQMLEAHHAYWGLLAMVAGFAGMFAGIPAWLVISICALGVWMFADDVYQHLRQRKEPGYLSPLHRWFYWLVRKII